MAINFTVNKSWTFKSQASYAASLIKFLLVYFVGYVINIATLSFFVDHLGFPAGWVQIVAIGFLIIYYFIVNKYFVFKKIS